MRAPLLRDRENGERDGERRTDARDERVGDEDGDAKRIDERPCENAVERKSEACLMIFRSDGGGECAKSKAGDEVDDVVLAGGERSEASESEKGEGDGFPEFARSKEQEHKRRADVERWKRVGHSSEADGDWLDRGGWSHCLPKA